MQCKCLTKFQKSQFLNDDVMKNSSSSGLLSVTQRYVLSVECSVALQWDPHNKHVKNRVGNYADRSLYNPGKNAQGCPSLLSWSFLGLSCFAIFPPIKEPLSVPASSLPSVLFRALARRLYGDEEFNVCEVSSSREVPPADCWLGVTRFFSCRDWAESSAGGLRNWKT